MSTRRPRADWRAWRSDVARRIDRATIVGALGLTVFSVALMHFEHANVDPAVVAARLLYWLTIVIVTVLALAVAMVAVARGAGAWMAYALAGVVIVTAAAAADLAFAPYAWKVGTANRHLLVAHLTILSMLLAPAAIFYVCASNAAHHARLLRSLDIERAAEAERLVQQRLQTELATIDHDLVLTGMRLALPLLAREAARAEQLLGAVTAYLRVAHQRGVIDARAVTAALEALRRLCTDRSGAIASG